MIRGKLSLLAVFALLGGNVRPSIAGQTRKQERKAQKQLAREQRQTDCYDNNLFRDELGNDCKFWTDLDCGTGASQRKFSGQGEVDLLQNCCRTCYMVEKSRTPSPTSSTPAP